MRPTTGRAAASRARKVRKAIRISRSMGSAALALAYGATGRFDAFVQQGGLSACDVAASGLITGRGDGHRHGRRPVIRPRPLPDNDRDGGGVAGASSRAARPGPLTLDPATSPLPRA